jgi:hypothetical protein
VQLAGVLQHHRKCRSLYIYLLPERHLPGENIPKD